MKIDRLIGILSVLLQQEMITAPELAEKFEVSRRTINRDIEVLCKEGYRSGPCRESAVGSASWRDFPWTERCRTAAKNR